MASSVNLSFKACGLDEKSFQFATVPKTGTNLVYKLFELMGIWKDRGYDHPARSKQWHLEHFVSPEAVINKELMVKCCF